MDQVQILKVLEKLRQRYQTSPAVREFTLSILGHIGQNDREGQISVCNNWVKQAITYVNDPEGVEYVTSPLRYIEKYNNNEPLYGDCDCHSLLLASMLGSLGFITRLVGVMMDGTDEFNHVIVGVKLDHELRLVDPCAKTKPQADYQKLLMV